MATLKPWIKSTLKYTLTDYLHIRDHGVPQNVADKYSYQCDLSNLRIISNKRTSEEVGIIQAHNTPTGIKAIVSDGAATINTFWSRHKPEDALCSQDETDSIIRPGNIIKILNPEFRITHCFNSPQVELHCDIIEPSDISIGPIIYSTNSEISRDTDIEQLLIKYSTPKEHPMETDNTMDSPISFKSQASPITSLFPGKMASVNDVESPDSSPISQMPFATQIMPLALPPGPLNLLPNKFKNLFTDDFKNSKNNRGESVQARSMRDEFEQDISNSQKRLLATFQKQKHERPLSLTKTQRNTSQHVPENMEKGDSSVNRIETETPQKKTPTTVSPDTRFATKSSSKPAPDVSLDVHHSHAHPTPDRVSAKAPVVQSARTTPIHADSKLPKVPDAVKVTTTFDKESLPLMPIGLVDSFSRWRAEAIAGRYVPRYATKITPDQQAILSSDERWQPALVGKKTRPGTVPLELLSRLTKVADEKPYHPVVTKNQEQGSNVVASESHDSTVKKDELKPWESPDSSQEVSNSQWPSSAPRPSREFPPDSSPVRANTSNVQSLEDDINCTNRSHLSEKQIYSLLDQLNPTSSRKPPADEHNIGHSMNSVPHNTGPQAAENRGSQSSKPQALSSTSFPPNTQVEADHTSISSQVQVRRTPLNEKDVNLGPSNTDSTGSKRSQHAHIYPMSSFVPGTYDEAMMRRAPNDEMDMDSSMSAPSQSLPSTRRLDRSLTGNSMSFKDRSERSPMDAETHRSAASIRGVQKMSHDDPSSCNIDMSGQASAAPNNNKHAEPGASHPVMSSPPNLETRNDRCIKANGNQLKDPMDLQLTDQGSNSVQIELDNSYMPSKKSCGHERKDDLHEIDPDYAAVVEDLRKYRRECLSALSKPQKVTLDKRLAHGSSQTSGASYDDNLEHESMIPSQSLMSDDIQHVSTPLTTHSFSITQANEYNGVNRKVLSFALTSEAQEVPALFERFISMYPHYQGKQEHLVKAVSLLQKLQLSNEAPQPSHYDDFVFHHYHSYRPYLMEVVESSGDALPYRLFYFNHIQSLLEAKDALKTSSLDNRGPANSVSKSRFKRNGSKDHKTDLIENDVSINQIPDGECQRNYAVESDIPLQPSVEPVENQDGLEGDSLQSSVTSWLDKAAGAESPELGTPDIDRSEVPFLKLADTAETESVNVKKRKRSSLTSILAKATKRHRKDGQRKGEESAYSAHFKNHFASFASGERAANLSRLGFNK